MFLDRQSMTSAALLRYLWKQLSGFGAEVSRVTCLRLSSPCFKTTVATRMLEMTVSVASRRRFGRRIFRKGVVSLTDKTVSVR